MVEERSEPFLLPFLRYLPSAFPSLVHAYPAVRPARSLLAPIPLGLRPWLHWLRSGSLRVVRRLRSYYGGGPLPAPVHHRLRLLAFPMRTSKFSSLVRRGISPVPTRSTTPRIMALHILRSAVKTVSAPAISSFRGSISHPTHALRTRRVRRCRRLTQHSLP